MKKGDIVRVFDGSYSLVEENGQLTPSLGTVLQADGEYEIIDVGKFPADNDEGFSKQENNLKLRCMKNPDRIVYIQSRLCSKVK